MALFPVTLDITLFRSLYTDFTTSAISDNQLNFLWLKTRRIAPSSIWGLDDATALTYWFDCLAHQADLFVTKQSGRLTGATTGNTSSTFENLPNATPGSLQWWNQTAYGQNISQLIRQEGGITYVS